jgi:hypothetical protein
LVEGEGEHNSVHGLVSKLLGIQTNDLVCSCAEGVGAIHASLEQELDLLLKRCSPTGIIVLADARDLERLGRRSCGECRELLQGRADRWRNSRIAEERFAPAEVVVVLADRTFDSWTLADFEAYRAVVSLRPSCEGGWKDVDRQLNNPCKWISDNVADNERDKDVFRAKAIFKRANLSVVEERSRSFRKFATTVRRLWMGR